MRVFRPDGHPSTAESEALAVGGHGRVWTLVNYAERSDMSQDGV